MVGIEHVAVVVAFFVRRAGEGGEIAVAGAIDEDAAEDRAAAGLRFDQQRLDTAVAVHRHAGGERMETEYRRCVTSSRSSAAHL